MSSSSPSCGVQVLTNVQSSPVGKYLVGVSEAGNILIYDAAALKQELRQVNFLYFILQIHVL